MNENNNVNGDVTKKVKKNILQNTAAHIPIKLLDTVIFLGIAAIAVLMFK